MSGGATTDLVYDLGTTTARWNWGYIDKVMCHFINPTSTSKCIVFGTTTAATTTADSDASVEFAGARGIILPRLSTAQIANLTSVDGMLLFNTTTGQLQVRKNGAWVNQGATVYKAQKSVVSSNSAVTQTALNITGGGGRINGVFFKANNSAALLVSASLILDGVTIFATTASMLTAGSHAFFNGAGMIVTARPNTSDTTTMLQTLSEEATNAAFRPFGVGLGSFDFASTAAVYFDAGGTGTITANVN
jgi:hypothetical protein